MSTEFRNLYPKNTEFRYNGRHSQCECWTQKAFIDRWASAMRHRKSPLDRFPDAPTWRRWTGGQM